jgi:site-specific DNA recombinase
MGVIRIKKTGETYLGAHEALVSKALYERVQQILSGKRASGARKHEFLFRRFITCKHCRYSLTAELQKGHIYYRCQSKGCPTKTIREEVIQRAVSEKFTALQLRDQEIRYLQKRFEQLERNWEPERQRVIAGLELQITATKERMTKLTDAYLDGVFEKDVVEQRKTALIIERRDLEDKLTAARENGSSVPKRLQDFLELAKAVSLTYESNTSDRKRRLLEKVTSNRVADGKNVEITLAFPYSEIAARFENQDGGASRSTARIWEALLCKVINNLRDVSVFHSEVA